MSAAWYPDFSAMQVCVLAYTSMYCTANDTLLRLRAL